MLEQKLGQNHFALENGTRVAIGSRGSRRSGTHTVTSAGYQNDGSVREFTEGSKSMINSAINEDATSNPYNQGTAKKMNTTSPEKAEHLYASNSKA